MLTRICPSRFVWILCAEIGLNSDVILPHGGVDKVPHVCRPLLDKKMRVRDVERRMNCHGLDVWVVVVGWGELRCGEVRGGEV